MEKLQGEQEFNAYQITEPTEEEITQKTIFYQKDDIELKRLSQFLIN